MGVFMYLLPIFALTGEGNTEQTAQSLSGLLKMATELLTWTITSMGQIITFITNNPLILIFMIITIVGFAVGFLMRIWHGVG